MPSVNSLFLQVPKRIVDIAQTFWFCCSGGWQNDRQVLDGDHQSGLNKESLALTGCSPCPFHVVKVHLWLSLVVLLLLQGFPGPIGQSLLSLLLLLFGQGQSQEQPNQTGSHHTKAGPHLMHLLCQGDHGIVQQGTRRFGYTCTAIAHIEFRLSIPGNHHSILVVVIGIRIILEVDLYEA